MIEREEGWVNQSPGVSKPHATINAIRPSRSSPVVISPFQLFRIILPRLQVQ